MALAAAAVAVIALVLASVLALKLRSLRADQRAVLGASGTDDLVGHAQRLDRSFEELTAYVRETAEKLEGRMATNEERIDGAVAFSAVVRYDAYNEMSGHQSSSIALLDARRTGLVLSSILHRDQARLYAKQITAGEPDLELSPEEQQAMDIALGRGRPVGEAAPPAEPGH